MGMILTEAFSAEIVKVSPLTDRILMVHVDDGYIIQPGYGQARGDAEVFIDPVDSESLTEISNYLLLSSDDPNYEKETHPLEAGRKSKPTEVHNLWPPPQTHANEHWVYLVLPHKLKKDRYYTLQVNLPVEGITTFEFRFDEYEHFSEAIHVNQVGYFARNVEKYAYVSHWMGDMGPLELDDYNYNLFYVVDVKNNEPVFVGKMKKRKDFQTGEPETQHVDETPRGQFHASDVYECDFTTCVSTGEFVIVIEGIGKSFPFRIEDDVYRDAFVTACRGLFLERAGIDKVEPWSRWNHKADHNGAMGYPLYYTSWRFMDSPSEAGDLEKAEALEKGRIETWGWYHDAGDWDGYPSHMVVPANLLTVYELAPGNFTDGELNIPESGNGIPDILDEASWLLRYFKRTREILLEKGWGTGGIAGARVHGDFWKKTEGVPSWEDTRKWYVFGEESNASFRYAGLSAHLAYCLNLAGKPDSALIWEKEALEVYDWAVKNTLPGDKIRNEKLYANAWLYKLTGKEKYHEPFRNEIAAYDLIGDIPGDHNFSYWAVNAYATMDKTKADSDLHDQLKKTVLWWADTSNVSTSQLRAFRFGISMGHPLVVGHATTPKVMPSVVAHAITGDKKYLHTLVHTSDYMLGGNPLNLSWVTGLGSRSPKSILHIDSWLDGVEDPIEGQVPYGPIFEGNRGGDGFNGPWDADYLRYLVYPDQYQWPGHELWSEIQWCPITNEYTVHQNICVAAAVYGYLCGKK